MTTWRIWDENGETTHEGDLDSARAAAEEYLRDGWNDADTTMWVDAWIEGDGERERVTVDIQPKEPACADSKGHEWDSPHEIVGGIKENPGVRGHGGGVIITEVCMRCGCSRITDTWAQRPDTGEQGLRSVSFRLGSRIRRAPWCDVGPIRGATPVKETRPMMPSNRRIKATDSARLTIEDLRFLVNWCDNQNESLWRPADRSDLTVGQILALYHAAQDAGYPGMDEWWSDARDAAREAWHRVCDATAE